MKKILPVLLAALLLSVVACNAGTSTVKPTDNPNSSVITAAATDQPSAPEQTDDPVRVAALAGPTGIGLTYLMQDQSESYAVDLFTAPDQVVAKVVSGEIDIAAVPVNLASVLYNKTDGDVVVIAVNTLGVLYFVENGNAVHSVADLAGNTIVSTGQASTPQYILEHILKDNQLTDSVSVEYLADNTELISKLVSGEVTIALLPEPHVSVALAQSESVRVALSANDLWQSANDAALVQGVYIVRRAFLTEHAELVNRFLVDSAASAQRVLTEENAPAAVVAQGIIGKEPIAARAIPNCNIVLKDGAEMKLLVSAMLETLFEADTKSIGGKLPADDFYYVP